LSETESMRTLKSKLSFREESLVDIVGKHGWQPSFTSEGYFAVQANEISQFFTIFQFLLKIGKHLLSNKKELEAQNHNEVDEEIFNLLHGTILLQNTADPSLVEQLISLLLKRFETFDWNGVTKSAFEQSLTKILYYLKSPELFLSIGGDDRLTLQVNQAHPEGLKLNKYFSSTFPRADIIRRGSCTCSTGTDEDYEKIVLRHYWKFMSLLFQQSLKENNSSVLSSYYDSQNEEILYRLRTIFHLDDPKNHCNDGTYIKKPQMVLFPSGTDAEYLPLIVGLIRSSSLYYERKSSTLQYITQSSIKVYNYLLAAGEVGSGTAQACSGQHFSPLAPRGNGNGNGSPLSGIDSSQVELVQFKPRNGAGDVSFDEGRIVESVLAHLAGNPTAVVILHLVCGSKTGLIYPSRESIDYLFTQLPNKEEDKKRIIVVVDACQGRCQFDHLIEDYLVKSGFMILFTGSKFFTAPPFCAGVLIPTEIANELENYLAEKESSFPLSLLNSVQGNESAETQFNGKNKILIPAGIIDYITQYEVSPDMIYFRKYLQELNALTTIPVPVPSSESSPSSTKEKEPPAERPGWYNYGLTLRWAVGIELMERYEALPTIFVKEFTRLWVETITNKLLCRSPFVQVLVDKITGISREEFVAAVNPIVSFSLFIRERSVEPHDEEKLVLRELTADEYKEFHKLMTFSMEDSLPGVKAMLGQPVKLSENEKNPLSGHNHVLRIALGADMVIRALEAIFQDKQNSETQPFSEQRLLTLLREAFHQISSLSSKELMKCFSCGESQLNPFVATLKNLLFDDFRVIEKLYSMIVQWKSVLPIQSLLETKDLPFISKVYREKLTALHELDLQLYRNYFPLPCSKNNPVIDLKTVQQVLLEFEKKKLFSSPTQSKSLILYDLDAVLHSFQSVKSQFSPYTSGTAFLHCFAVKSCPIRYILHLAVRSGLGLECASLTEVKLALSVGCLPEKIIFDSPCKSYDDLLFVLTNGIRMNANSFEDLRKIDLIIQELFQQGIESQSQIGLRINPLVGSGSIQALSTATRESKFGVPLFSEETSFFPSSEEELESTSTTTTTSEKSPLSTSASGKNESTKRIISFLETINEKDDCFQSIVNAYEKYSFLKGIMCHVGSQGMDVSQMVEGIQRLYWVMQFLEHRWSLHSSSEDGSDRNCQRKIDWLDIGGGLSCNYQTNKISPTFAEYSDEIFKKCPQLYQRSNSSTPFTIITEFGKTLISKTAVVVSKIEDIIHHPMENKPKYHPNHPLLAVSLPRLSAITHVGADLFVRNAYVPTQFTLHRMKLVDGGNHFVVPVTDNNNDTSNQSVDNDLTDESLLVTERSSQAQVNVVGPLCFSGDVLAKELVLPTPMIGDSLLFMDCGGNTLSLFSRHCSRQSPAVVGFRRLSYEMKGSDREQTELVMTIIRQQETAEDVMRFWE
jgi:diaminopimelate decarboxylase